MTNSTDDLILASLSWHLFNYSFVDFALLKSLRTAGIAWDKLHLEIPEAHHLAKLKDIGEFWHDIERAVVEVHRKHPGHRLQLYPFYDPLMIELFSGKIDRPFLLQCIGKELFNNTHPLRLGVVGSREPRHGLAEFIERWINQQISKHPITIISGGARGIDQIAHQTAFLNQSDTWIWIPSGLSQIYPSSLSKWLPLIKESRGTMISLFHPKSEMRKNFFAIRNSYIAASSNVMMVASAANKSGSMITAKKSIEYGVPLYSVPSDPWIISAQGSLGLIRDGAVLVSDEFDIPDWQSIARNLPEFIHSQRCNTEIWNPNGDPSRHNSSGSHVLHPNVNDPVSYDHNQ
jgi:DNA processing protein